MREVRGFVCCGLLIAVAALLPAAGQAPDAWINARTSHFDIVSNGREREVRDLASNLEQFVAVVSRLLTTEEAPGVPVTVLAFRDERSFRPYRPLYRGQPVNVSGFFQRTQDGALIALDMSASREGRPFAVIFHEYTHLLAGDAARAWPLWLSEGLAEFYSTFEADRDRVTLGVPIAGHVLLLRQEPLVPFDQLSAVDRQSPSYNEGLRQNVFYARAWALVHYLMHGNNTSRQPQLRQFIQALAGGAAPDRAFRESFPESSSVLGTELRGYVARRAFPVVTLHLTTPLTTGAIETRTLSAAQSQWRLGDLLLQSDRLDEAERTFRGAVALDAGEPAPHEGLAFLAIRRNQPDVAIGHFRDAIARKSRNHLAHYTYADTLWRQAPPTGPSPDVIERVLDGARTAVGLEPRFLPAWHLLGSAYLAAARDQDWADGVRAMTDARAAFPADGRIALLLAALQARRGDYRGAREHLNAVLASPLTDESLRGEARRLLTQVEEALLLQTIRATQP